MSEQSIHFSSNTDEWETPSTLFDKLNKEFNFDFDLCASKYNAKCSSWTADLESFVSIAKDEPFNTFFMNPPYSRGKQKKMIGFAHELFLMGKTIACILPARTDTAMFHKYIWDEEKHETRKNIEMRLLKGRVKFELNGKAKDAAPFPSMVVIFKGCINCKKLKGIERA